MLLQALDLDKAFEAYSEAKKASVRPSNVLFTNLLCLSAGLGDQGSGFVAPRITPPPQDIDKAFVIFNDMKTFCIPFAESAYTALIRCCALHNRHADALQLYYEMTSQNIAPRIRSLSSLLQILAEQGDTSHCEEIFTALSERYELIATEKEYASMLQVHLYGKNEESFTTHFSAMMDDLLVISYPETMDILQQWFSTCSPPYTITHSLVSKEGILEVNQEKLLSVDLEDSTREGLLKQLELFAVNRDGKFKPNNKTRDLVKESSSLSQSQPSQAHRRDDDKHSESRLYAWESYKQWLEARQQTRSSSGADAADALGFDVIVDGANVGYYKQNYANAPKHVAYEQIDHMLQLLMDSHRRPLLILHSRHLSVDMVPSAQIQAMIGRWQQAGMLYTTPRGFNDDWFWMYAAIKYKCQVVTNDDMRDHHFQLFSPRWSQIV